MLADRVSNPGPLAYEAGALPIALRGPATSKGLKNEFETALINEPSVFEPLKVYCNCTIQRCIPVV